MNIRLRRLVLCLSLTATSSIISKDIGVAVKLLMRMDNILNRNSSGQDSRAEFKELISAITDKDTSKVQAILNACENKTALVNHSIAEITPLSYAFETNLPEIASLLIECNADLNVQDSGGDTPFMVACCWGKDQINALLYNMLTERRANATIANKKGLTPLHLAATNLDGTTLLKALVEAHADPNARSISGVTPLMAAAMMANRDAITQLLALNADPNITDDIGASPLSLAVLFGKSEPIQPLIDAGADFTRRNNQGFSAFSITCDGPDQARALECLIAARDKRVRAQERAKILAAAQENHELLHTLQVLFATLDQDQTPSIAQSETFSDEQACTTTTMSSSATSVHVVPGFGTVTIEDEDEE